MSQIHFILTRPDRTMLLIQLAFNQSNNPSTSPLEHQRYLMRAVNQAIENVMTNNTLSSHTSSPNNPSSMAPLPLNRSNSQIIRSSYNEAQTSSNQTTNQRPMLSPASSRASHSLFHSLSSMIETPRRTHRLARPQSSTDLNADARQPVEEVSAAVAEEPTASPSQTNLGALVSEFLHDSIRQTLQEAYTELNEPNENEEMTDQSQTASNNQSTDQTINTSTAPSSATEPSDQPSLDRQNSSDTEEMRSLPRPPALRSISSEMSDDNQSIDLAMDESGEPERPPLSRAMSEPQLTTEQARTQNLNQIMQDQVIHRDVCCDSCGQTPIRGVRYKCRQCENFDFCATCHLACPIIGDHTKEHSYRVFTQPRPDPLVRALEDFLILVLHSGFVSVRLIGGVASDTDAMTAIYQSMMGATHHQGTPPASKRAIDALEHLVVEGSVDTICVFCQESLVEGDEATLFPCGTQPHCYHSSCLLPWLKEHSNCPLCQKCIENVDEERLNGPLGTINEHSPDRSESPSNDDMS